MSIEKKDVEHIANLARLTFNEEEKEGLIKDLNNILLYVEKLNQLDTDNEEIIVNPYYIENKFREDVVQPSMDLKEVMKNAPESLEEYIVVPQVISGGGDQ